jgi:glycosyltransferase involved in cell wall biosynthesis
MRQAASESSPTAIMKPVFVLQRILPDYRVGFYAALQQLIPDKFFVTTGVDGFMEALKPSDRSADWILSIKNTYFFGNRLLWQSGRFRQIIVAPLLVAELNPRILSTWVLLLLRRILRRPSVVWGHSRSLGERHPLVAALRFWQCRLGGAVVAYTHTQAEEFRIKLPTLPVFVAPNSCVSVKDCVAQQGALAFDVLYVGRLIPEKKVALLIGGFAAAARNLPPEAKLKVVGDGPERAHLEKLAVQTGLADRIEFSGHVTDEEILKKLYAGAACSVSPGYIGLSAMQSLAHGVPMLVSSDEHHSPEIEVCVPNVTAMFFPSNSVEGLSEAMISFFKHHSLWLNKRREIARFIAERYSFEAMVSGFFAMVGSLAPEICVKKPRPAAR